MGESAAREAWAEAKKKELQIRTRSESSASQNSSSRWSKRSILSHHSSTSSRSSIRSEEYQEIARGTDQETGYLPRVQLGTPCSNRSRSSNGPEQSRSPTQSSFSQPLNQPDLPLSRARPTRLNRMRTQLLQEEVAQQQAMKPRQPRRVTQQENGKANQEEEFARIQRAAQAGLRYR